MIFLISRGLKSRIIFVKKKYPLQFYKIKELLVIAAFKDNVLAKHFHLRICRGKIFRKKQT